MSWRDMQVLTVPSADWSQWSDRRSMSGPAPSPTWMQLQLLQDIASYLERDHGVNTASQVPALPGAPVVLLWGCRVQGQGWGWLGWSLNLPSSLSPRARGCQLSQHLTKVPLHPSAPPLPCWQHLQPRVMLVQEAGEKPGSRGFPPPAALRRQHRRGLSQVLRQEQNILPLGSQSSQQLG